MYLILGQGLMPFEKDKKNTADGLRTVQFLDPFVRNNLNFLLITVSPNVKKMQKTVFPGTESIWIKLTKNEALNYKFVDDLVMDHIGNEKKIKAIVGINNLPSYIAANLRKTFYPRAPFWADLNGWIMAEGVSQGISTGHMGLMPHYHEMQDTILRHADFMSAVSFRQKWAIYGEMMDKGLIGKHATFDFITTIPNAHKPKNHAPSQKLENPSYLYKKYGLPEDKFLVLSTGGYNTWMDVDTMFKGLENAIKKDRSIHFVTTGGSIEGLDENIYKNFQRKVDRSKYKKHFHLLGWIDKEDVVNLYKICHVGICVDKWNIETATGARNRITEFMMQRIPVLTTEGTEIAEIVETNNLGLVARTGNAESLADEINKAANLESPVLDKFAQNAFVFSSKTFGVENVTRYFADWVKEPIARRHEHIKIHKTSKIMLIKKFFKFIKEKGIKETFGYVWRHWKKMF